MARCVRRETPCGADAPHRLSRDRDDDVSCWSAPVVTLVSAWHTLQETYNAAARLGDVFDAEREQPDRTDLIRLERLDGSIRREDVTFTYQSFGAKVLDRISVEIRPGERVATVGPSGSGKSTLAKVLMGQHQPTSGRVLLSGFDSKTLDLASVRRRSCSARRCVRRSQGPSRISPRDTAMRRVRPGQSAQVAFDAFPRARFGRFPGPSAVDRARRGRARLLRRVDRPRPAPGAPAGLLLDAQILLERSTVLTFLRRTLLPSDVALSVLD